MNCELCFRPVHDEPICDGRWVWEVRKIVAFVPASIAQLSLLEFDFAREIVCRKTDHQAARIGPRLRGEVTDVCDAKMRLFPNFALHAFLQRFACLDEARYEAVMAVAKGVGMNHEYLVASGDTDDNGGCQAGPKFLAALLALLADFRLPTHLAATNAAELRVLMEIDQLGTLACQLVILGRKDVERLSERHHLQVGAVRNGMGKRGNNDLTSLQFRNPFPRFQLDGRRVATGNRAFFGEKDIALAEEEIPAPSPLPLWGSTWPCHLLLLNLIFNGLLFLIPLGVLIILNF